MLVLFTLAVAGIVAAIDMVVIVFFGLGREHGSAAAQYPLATLVYVSLAVIAVIGIATLYRISTLRSGGSAVAAQLGARAVPEQPGELVYRRLRNVVEEVAIASGVPVPEIFVLEDELGINAFAAGYSPSDAAVTVTRGCLDKLTRDELQGVIAHEFSHVLNGDMRLNIRLVGVAFGILVVAIIGRKLAEGAGRSGRGGAYLAILGVGLLGIGYFGVFFARLIKASISRQREFLADASAVQFTRQTEGIAGALKKIGGLAAGSTLSAHNGEEVAHMLFGDGVGYSSLFATHPPLLDRIRRLQPRFDPAELARIAQDWSAPRKVSDSDDPRASLAGFLPAGLVREGRAVPSGQLPPAGATFPLGASDVSNQVGHPDSADFATAATLCRTLPAELERHARSRDVAMPLIHGLVLAGDAEVRARQLKMLALAFDASHAERVQACAELCRPLHPMQRLPLAALAFPALRRQPRKLLTGFVDALQAMIEADAKVSLDEYCLARLVRVQVIETLDPPRGLPRSRLKTTDAAAEIRTLFAVLAQHGQEDTGAARAAYLLGIRECLPADTHAYSPPIDWVAGLDRALDRLDQLMPIGKEMLVRGLTLTISADGRVHVREAELLRTICASLHCPLPPLLNA